MKAGVLCYIFSSPKRTNSTTAWERPLTANFCIKITNMITNGFLIDKQMTNDVFGHFIYYHIFLTDITKGNISMTFV
jgi:hypothetical protein